MDVFKHTLIVLLILSPRPGLAQENGLRYEKADTSFGWRNLADFETGEEYLRALDLEFVAGLDADSPFRKLVDIAWGLTLDYDSETRSALVEQLNATDNPALKGLYAGILMELLENEDEYAAMANGYPDTGKTVIARNFAKVSDPYRIRTVSDPPALNRLERNHFGHVKIEVGVGTDTLFALFDTGADHTVVSASFATAHNVRMLSDETGELGTPNGLTLDTGFGVLDELHMGSVVVRDIPVFVFADDLMSFGVEPDIDRNQMIIGWSVISKLRFEIDVPRASYTTRESVNVTGPYEPNFFWFGYPGLKMAAPNGQSLLFGFDAGAAESNLKSGIFKKLDLTVAYQDTVGHQTAGGIDTVFVDVVEDFPFLLDGYQVSKPAMEVHTDADFYFLLQDGLIGADIFPGNRVVIDYPNRLFRIVRGVSEAAISKIDSVLVPLSMQYPGMAASISRRGVSVYSKGFGFRDLTARLPFEPGTPFNLYSVSKTFTGVALAKLMEAGRIDIDAPITGIDDSLPDTYSEITPKLLVSHMSGLRHYDNDWLQFASAPCDSPKEAIGHFIQDRLAAEPGTTAIYSTFGFVLLSHIIDLRSATSYESFLQENIFDKAGMNRTYLDGRNPADSARAVAYYRNNETESLDVIEGVHNSCKFGGGGFVTTTVDMLKFAQALLASDILSTSGFQRFYTPISDPVEGLIEHPEIAAHGYAMGVEYHAFAANDTETLYIGHGGSSAGGNAYLMIFPDEGLSIALAANSDGSGMEDAAKAIATILLEDW